MVWAGLTLTLLSQLRAKLAKPGEPPTKTILDIMFYVRSITACVLVYLTVTVMFVLSVSDTMDNGPQKWWLWALLVYQCLGQVRR